MKYVRNNFVKPRDPDAMDAVMVRRDLARWQHEIADVRVHGTTGQRPIDLFEQEEKAALLPLPKERYELVVWKEATVHPDSHVLYDKKLYSVPFQHIGRRVWMRASAASVVVYFDDKRIATHPRRCHGSRSTCDTTSPASFRSSDRAPPLMACRAPARLCREVVPFGRTRGGPARAALDTRSRAACT